MKRPLCLVSLAALLLGCSDGALKPSADAATMAATGGTVGGGGGSGGTMPGTGGSTGARDASATGGTATTGGASGTGGTLAAGGAVAAGGATGTGGRAGAGGAVADAASDAPLDQDGGVDGGIDSGAAPSLDGPWQAGTGETNGPPMSDANCSTMMVRARRGLVDVLLVLDRSSSMGYSLADDCSCDSASAAAGVPICRDTTNCVARWTAVTAAVGTATSSTPDVSWGLKLFGTPSSTSDTCAVSKSLEVPVGPDTAAMISATITGAVLANSTPTAAALSVATAYLATLTDTASKAIVLATDGQPNCGEGEPNVSDIQGTVTSISAARQAGYPVYVVGIGPSVGNLDKFAQAGGTRTFYPATSTATLTSALLSISKAVGTCTFALEVLPPDSNHVGLYLDGSPVPKDAVTGWSFGANVQTIEFHGSYCESILAGAAIDVRAAFACPGGNLPPFLH